MLLVVGLITGVALSLKQSGAEDCVAVTKIQMKEIQGAMERFVSQNERYPLPALRTAGVEDIKYGREVTAAELAANPSLLDVTVPPVTVPPTSSVTYGALPFQALGLAPSYAGDCWGNKFTYAVTTDLTESGKFNQELPLQTYEGVITVQSDASSAAPVSVKAAYVVVSHGANALGAVKANYSSSTGDKKYCTLSGSLESENCEPSNAVLMGAAYNDGKDAGPKFFDDIITFSDKKQRSVNGVCNNAVPNSCAVGSPSGDTVETSCGTTRNWTCNGSGGGNDAPCEFHNPPCAAGCAPNNSSYLWNGLNWDDYGTPNWTPSQVGVGMSVSPASAGLTNGQNMGSGITYNNNRLVCNASAGCAAGWGPETTLDSDSVFVDCGSLSAAQCNSASQNACSILFQNQINNTGGCASGPGGDQGGNAPSTSGNINECVTYVNGTNANNCQLIGRRCGSGPTTCTPCVQFSGNESDLYGAGFPGAAGRGCWDYTHADCHQEVDLAPCDGTNTTPPPGWAVCGGGGPTCTADNQSSGGNAASCCNGDSDNNGICGSQTSLTSCCYTNGNTDIFVLIFNGPEFQCSTVTNDDGNCNAGLQGFAGGGYWEKCGSGPCNAGGGSCGAGEDYGSCTGTSCEICCNGATATCANNLGGNIIITLGYGCDGSLCAPPSSCAPTDCKNSDLGGTGVLDGAHCSGCSPNGTVVNSIGAGCRRHRCNNGVWTNLGSGAPCPIAAACFGS